MNFKYIYLLLLCLVFKLNIGQVYFNNRYDLFTKADAAADIFLKDSSYFVSCGGLDVTQSNLSLSVQFKCSGNNRLTYFKIHFH